MIIFDKISFLRRIYKYNVQKGKVAVNSIENYGFQFPDHNFTDELWQIEFAKLKKNTKPTGTRYMYIGSRRDHRAGDIDCDNRVRYAAYVNEVLKHIRHGGVDYCFHSYQVIDLLRYEPNLIAKYDEVNECFRVFVPKSFPV